MEFVDHFLSLDASLVLWPDMLEFLITLEARVKTHRVCVSHGFVPCCRISVEDSSRFLETSSIHTVFTDTLLRTALPIWCTSEGPSRAPAWPPVVAATSRTLARHLSSKEGGAGLRCTLFLCSSLRILSHASPASPIFPGPAFEPGRT